VSERERERERERKQIAREMINDVTAQLCLGLIPSIVGFSVSARFFEVLRQMLIYIILY